MSRKLSWLFISIIAISALLRLLKLASLPPSLNWDETAAAYNAFTIKNWAKDEYGNYMPLVFRSFADDKHPIHIYITALFYGFFGVSDFTTRLPSAVVGVLTVILLFLIGREYFKSDVAGIFAAFFMGLSGYHIHYSRGLWEANFALFFFVAGLALFKIGLDKKRLLIPISYLLFGISLLSYHSSKVVVPPLVILLTIFYIKDLKRKPIYIFAGIGLFVGFIVLLFIEPRLLGLARISQTNFPKTVVDATYLYQRTGSELLGRIEVSLSNYQNYFTRDYLFKTGDQLPRGYIGVMGQFYKLYVVIFPLGLLFLLIRKKWKILLILLSWLLLAPIPGAIAGKEPNSTRAIFMLGSVELISAYGAYAFVTLFKSRLYRYLISFVIVAVLFYECFGFLDYYFSYYSKNEAIQWQYGFKQTVEFVKSHPEYERVYVTKIRNQPYIFFLYYLRTPLPQLLASVIYDETGSKSYNTVESFGKYNFGNWDFVESAPIDGYLYIVTQNEYQGMRSYNQFKAKDIIKYPGGDDAFYIVSVN